MLKVLYILPALAVMGLFSVADATTEEQRVAKLNERIENLEGRITEKEQSRDWYVTHESYKTWIIDKLNAKIAQLEARVNTLESLKDTEVYKSKLEAKIIKLENRITFFENKADGLDSATDQNRIDKINAKILKLQDWVTAIQAKIAALDADLEPDEPA